MGLRLGLACMLGGAAGASEEPVPPRVLLAVEAGVRSGSFAWRSGEDGVANPPFSARWSDLRALTAGLRLSEAPGRPIALRLALTHGWVVQGDSRQSGFAPGTGEEVYRSENDGGGGWMADGSVDAGLTWASPAGRWQCTPLLGFQDHLRHLRQRDGDQAIPDTGPYDGLDSTFDAEWFGPRAGVEVGYRWDAGTRLRLLGNMSLLWYRAHADWNLRSDLDHPESYTQDGHGFGWRMEAALDLPSSSRWLWSLRAAWDGMRVTNGSDRIRVAAGPDMSADLTSVAEDAWSFALSAGVRL